MIYYADGSKSSMGCQIAVTDIAGNLLVNVFLDLNLTNNELEYYAILYAANLAENNSTIYSDSNLCVQQINGSFKIKKLDLKPFVEKIKTKVVEKNLKIEWISRNANLAGHLLEKIVKRHTKQRHKLNENN